MQMRMQKQPELQVTKPELAMIAGTRGALGAGIGLLAAPLINDERRKGIGWTLVAVGLLSTIPLALEVFRKRR